MARSNGETTLGEELLRVVDDEDVECIGDDNEELDGDLFGTPTKRRVRLLQRFDSSSAALTKEYRAVVVCCTITASGDW